MRFRILFSLSTIGLLALAPACKKEQKDAPAATAPQEGSGSAAATAPTPPPAEEAKPAAALNDAQIAAIVVAANQVDVDAGELAMKISKNAEIKAFAERMVTDHNAVNKAAGELVTKLGVTPEESDASKGLTAGGAETRAKLEKLEGAAFDKAYVDNEVAYHEAVIGVLNTQLIPSATNAELKAALVGAKPAFDAHLEHAKKIQAALASGDTAAAKHAHE